MLSVIRTHMERQLGRFEPGLISHMRDRQAIADALAHINRARNSHEQLELAAESLRAATDVLSRLLGVMDSEMVLDRLFAGFCIGK